MIFFDTIIKRVTNFSVQSYENNKSETAIFFENNELFQLSVLTASSILYEDIKKNKSEKIKTSLYKYFTRAHLNPTPFGVFNSVGILKWGKFTSITKSKTLKLSVKYDNLFLSKKINNSIANDWSAFSYCINPSIQILNEEKIGFYKSKNLTTDKIELSYVEIDYDIDLQWIIDEFKSCIKINLVLEKLVLEGFERTEVESYLFEIIETGLIIEEFLYFPYTAKLANQFNLFPSSLIQENKIELKCKNDFDLFKKKYVEEQKFFLKNSDEKYSHCINSFETEQGSLDINIQNKIKKFIDFTIYYNSETIGVNDTLNKFIDKLSDRFTDGLIPINKVFNPYSGLNYASMITKYKLKLHEEIILKIISSNENDIFLNLPIKDDLIKKSSKIPVTFNVLLEVLSCKVTGDKITYIQKLAGTSALKILSRFSEVGNDICLDIVNYEKEVHRDKIIAELNCIGTNRSINISAARQMYDYCIPINTSYTAASNPILLSDIYIHLRDRNISLVSKKNRKQILPKKTSAVNAKLSDSDVYNFLCDFEYYNQELYGISFDFNLYDHLKPYVPRIFLEKDVLLYPAQLLLIYNNYNIKEFKIYLNDQIEKYSFTNRLNCFDTKGNLIIDTECESDIIQLYEKLKEKKHFYVSEFLYESFNPEIVSESENFPHELIVSIKNTNYKSNNIDYNDFNFDLVQSKNSPIVSDWLYLELFCNSYADSEVLKCIYSNIISENKYDQFFFVHYNNPNRHLRLRFKTNSIENKQHIINIVSKLKSNNIISNYHILPYEQEIYRYGGLELMELSETIFNLDTKDLLINVIKDDLNDNSIRIISILKIINYLEFLNYSIEEMILFCESSINNYSKEFELTSQLRKEFNKEFYNIKFNIESYEYNSFLRDDLLRNNLVKQLKKTNYNLKSYSWLLIHMSMNRHFNEMQRFNEFKSYYLTKCYLNQIKFKNNPKLKPEVRV